jgi:photosystem I subunit 2
MVTAETEEKYVMTWTNSRNKTAVEENIFEMPTGGAAIMKQGPNLCILLVKNNV